MRKTLILKNDWYFTDTEQNNMPWDTGSFDGGWQKINLPHTWNALDGQDGGADYYRSECRYARKLYLPSKRKDRKYYLRFGAASQLCRVYVNGAFAFEHKGGYSAFNVDISDIAFEGENVIDVRVSNAVSDEIYPQMADFTFYGGLHREVSLIELPLTHFDMDYYGASGFCAASVVSDDGRAALKLEAFVCCPQTGDTVRYLLRDAYGHEVAELYRSVCDTKAEIDIPKVHLWQGTKDPYLYSVSAEIVRNNEVLDKVSVLHGFRRFEVDAQRGFILNGIPTPLRGVSRHQDKLGKGNALDGCDHELDFALIKEMGANTVRLAHYQQSEEVYELCDRYGFVVWAEIPFISKMLQTDAAHENCVSQMKELIFQNYNHSSICFWGISNEITIGGSSDRLNENLRALNALCHELDPYRLTTMAQVSQLPMDDVQNEITDTVSYNHYFGWYGGELSDNEKWLDAFHSSHPQRPIGISEYGCEGIIKYHGNSPVAGDYSEEYQALYHEHMLKVIEQRSWLWATHVWNMFDFGCDARDEGGVKGRNNKGLVTFDRRIKKDAFYLYKAYYSEEPFLHICGKRYSKRVGQTTTVKVYSNAPRVTLAVNGQSIATLEGEKVFVFGNVTLKDGFNTVRAFSGEIEDMTVLEKTDNLPDEYTLKTEPGEVGVTNWFDGIDESQSSELHFEQGRYSVNDTVRELLESDEAGTVLVNAFSSATGMKLKKSMLMMMADQTPQALFKSNLASKGPSAEVMLARLNDALQKIEKK